MQDTIGLLVMTHAHAGDIHLRGNVWTALGKSMVVNCPPLSTNPTPSAGVVLAGNLAAVANTGADGPGGVGVVDGHELLAAQQEAVVLPGGVGVDADDVAREINTRVTVRVAPARQPW